MIVFHRLRDELKFVPGMVLTVDNEEQEEKQVVHIRF